MKTAVIIQARMSSTRLPGKNLLPLVYDVNGNPLCALDLIYDSAMSTGVIDQVIIACPEHDQEVFADHAERQKREHGRYFFVHGGSELNVYMRTLMAALYYSVDVIVDITGDCPLVPAFEIKRLVDTFLTTPGIDYLSNALPERHVPDGWDVQVYSTEYMRLEHCNVTEKQHSGWNIMQPAPVGIMEGMYQPGAAELRITLDTPEDRKVIQKIAPFFLEKQYCLRYLKACEFLDYLLSQPPEWWDNRKVVAKKAGEG
jgi:spore coat polysaccharide biosynthesis protein SpsF